jgi:hypothetical protein
LIPSTPPSFFPSFPKALSPSLLSSLVLYLFFGHASELPVGRDRVDQIVHGLDVLGDDLIQLL